MTTDLDVVLDRAPKVMTYRPLPKVKSTIPHRSDIYFQEQVRKVQESQEAMKTLMKQIENVSSEEEFHRYTTEVDELKEKTDKMVVMLKVSYKIYSEMAFAREGLKAAIRSGQPTESIRKRIFWLENRLEKLLGKEKSPQVLPKPSLLPPPPPSPPSRPSDAERQSEEKQKSQTTAEKPPSLSEAEKSPKEPAKGDDDVFEAATAKSRDDEDTGRPGDTFLTECPPATSDATEEKSESDSASDDSATETELQSTSDEEDDEDEDEEEEEKEAQSEDHKTAGRPAKEGEKEEEEGHNESSSRMAADTYLESEHHRFKFVDNAGVLLELDPSSYHNLAIAEPGTYVEEVRDTEATLPWRPRRRDSEFEEIHKDALNSLVKRVHTMYNDLHDAAMLSVDPHYKDEKSKGTFLDSIDATKDNDIMVDGALALPDVKVPRKAGHGRVYYPTPLLAPVKLPTAKLDRSKVYPPNSSLFSASALGEARPAQRIVNQGALYDETRFTSSLFRKRRAGRGLAGAPGAISSAEDRRLREWVRSSDSASGSAKPGPATRSEDAASDPSRASEPAAAPKKGVGAFRNRVQVVRGAQKFALNTPSIRTDMSSEVGGGLWKHMKPKSGALHHSGLKWERIKEIVHHNLSSDRPLERQDAARTLGLLRCADGMVLFALRKAMLTDSDPQTRFEATKALVLLGCWEENVLDSVILFLKRGDANVRVFLIQAMIKGKNVQFVDKGLPSFPRLAACLSQLCSVEEVDVAFHAAVCLGRLCVADANARTCLLAFLQRSDDDDRIIQACEALVRQMNCTERLVVDTVLHRLRWSPAHRNRSLSARLLVLLGPRVVCSREEDEDRVFALLETRLWDDPMKEVRLDIAKAIIALDMFPRACERAERKLENADEDVRGQAVMAIGTLGIRNERIIRTLLEMLELDPSEYIRILVIRTFGAIGLADKRIIRSLQEKEKLETMFANEARKALKLLQNS